MAQEYLNYDRSRTGENLVSSDYAVFSLGGQTGEPARALVQNVNINYGHRVELRPEVGSHEMLILSGQASGQASMSRLVGQGGLVNKLRPGGAGTLDKGTLGVCELDVSSSQTASDGTTQAGVQFSSIINMDRPVLQSISWGVSAAGLELSESVNIVIPSLRVSTSGAA
jgi:hypothetical protein